MVDPNDSLFRKMLSRASENDEALRKFCKNANITLDKVPIVEVEQVSPVIVNTYSEAPNANGAKQLKEAHYQAAESLNVTAHNTSRKRKRHSSERDQTRDKKQNKQQRLLETLTKLLSVDKQLNKLGDKPVQGYVTKEKYVQLMDKYNDLQADYTALQQRFKLTLKLLEASAADSDTDESDSDALENISQVNERDITLDDSQNNGISAVEGITTGQWYILSSSKDVKQFGQRALRLLFDEETLLTSTVTGKPSYRNRSVDGYLAEPKMLDVNKIQTIRDLLEQYMEEKKFPEHEKASERKSLTKYMSVYIAYLKHKHKEGDISHL